MSFFKKKIGALIPNEIARGALQNVLTVEWGTHKTVLVEVPQAGPSNPSEVEMSGIGSSDRDHATYGRLSDGDDERVYLNAAGQDEYYLEEPRLPPRPTKTHSQAFSKTKALPPLPERPTRGHSNNPFHSEADYEANRGTGFDGSRYEASRAHPALQRHVTEQPRGWRTFDSDLEMTGSAGDGRRAEGMPQRPGNPWGGHASWNGNENGNGMGGGFTSPSSSRGTRSSATGSMEEDPFR